MTRLRLTLLAILVGVALLPAVPAAWLVSALVDEGLDPVLEETVTAGTEAGLATARDLLELEKRAFGRRLADGDPVDTLDAARLAALTPREQSTLASMDRGIPTPSPEAPSLPDRGGMTSGDPGAERVLLEPARVSLGGREMLVARVATGQGRAWAVHPLPETLVASVGALTRSHRLVQSVRHEREKVVRTLVLTFLAVYGGILALVLGLGVLLASRMTRPVAVLGRGIESVAAGDLETRVPRVAGGAVGNLLDAFNGMVRRLGEQQHELARLERLAAWRQMARRLAHEVKNPLTPIQLAAQEMRDAYPGGDDDYRSLLGEGTSIIEEEVRSLRTLVAEFSEFSRMPAPKLAPLALPALLDEIAGLYRDDVTLGEVADVTLHADREQLHRVLVNLVNNALDAQREAGVAERVTVEARVDGEVSIRVLDRGPGVPEEMRRRIFEPDVTTKSDGMGLGLAIVESTLLAHGGSIAVTDRDGGGAVFEVLLPLKGDAS